MQKMATMYEMIVLCVALLGLRYGAGENITTTEFSTTTTNFSTPVMNPSSTLADTSKTATHFTSTTESFSTVDSQVSEEEETSSNQVTVTFYALRITQFDEEGYASLVAEELTEYCNAAPPNCRLLPSSVHVKFEADNVKTAASQVGRNVDVATLVLYPQTNLTVDGSNVYVVPKSALAKMIISKRDSFKEVIGTDIIDVNGKKYGIKASVVVNVILCITFTMITLILFILVMLLRKHENDLEDQERKQSAISLKQNQYNNEAYKIRPGPDPIDRYQSSKRAPQPLHGKVTKAPSNSSTEKSPTRPVGDSQRLPSRGSKNHIAPHTPVDGPEMVSNGSTGVFQTGAVPEYSPSSTLPSIDDTNEHSKHEKKKKKRKHRDKNVGETGVEMHGYSNTVYDQGPGPGPGPAGV